MFSKSLRFGKFALSFALSLSLGTPQAGAWSGFGSGVRCDSIFMPTSHGLVLRLNRENNNFLEMNDDSEDGYGPFRELHRKQQKKLENLLDSLDLRSPYTEKQKYDWSKEVVDKIGRLVGENDLLRQRAQAQFLHEGLNGYLAAQLKNPSLPSRWLHRYHRTMETVFDNHVTRWATVPFLFPQLRYPGLTSDLVKKILFTGYDRNEPEVRAALKETDRIAAYNKFARVHKKILILTVLILVPVVIAIMTDRTIDQASESVVQEMKAAEVQSKVLDHVDWHEVENAFVFLHAKEILEQRLGRPLSASEAADLKQYLAEGG